jgi:hypothetical protein
MLSPRDARTPDILQLPLLLLPKPARIAVAHRFREHRETRKARRCDVMVLSRAKSGRTWLRAMLSRLYQAANGLPEKQLLEFDNFHRKNAAIPKIFFTHGRYLRERLGTAQWQERFRHKRVIFLVRNPCDVAVSEYFQSTRRASEHKTELYAIDREVSMYDFVMTSGMGLPAIIDYFNAWEPVVSQLPSALVVRYEDMRARPEASLAKIVDFLEAPFTERQIAEAVDFASFENLKEKERTNFFANRRLAPRDATDPDSFKVRRGKVGGYRDYFDGAERERMEDLVRSRLSPRFGYGEPGGGLDAIAPSGPERR